MKKISILCVTIFLCSTSYSKQCITSWELKSSGFTIGTTKEILNIKHDGALDLTADFNPNIALKIFGVNKVKRSIVMNAKHDVITRQETVGIGQDIKKVTWEKIDNQIYNRVIKDEIIETVVIDDGKRIIDSTIFPYMFYLGMFDSNKMNVKIFGSDPIYDAVVSLTTDKTRLDFAGGKSKGYVIVNEDKYPQYFNFTQDGKTVEGIQKSWQCN